MYSKFQRSEPSLPYTSTTYSARGPTATRLASKLATTPPSRRARMPT